jgi:limonene 1,2-monooxygenase
VRTRRIRLGTGVISLPYHNPLMVADRIVQLDHQTRGRAMFGMGPGLLPSDANMLGISPDVQRDRMVQGVDVIVRLLAGQTITERTDWYELRNAQIQLPPYTLPHPHLAVASAVTPSGAKVAGRYGIGLLGVAASSGVGFGALGTNWEIAEREAAAHGNVMPRENFRLVAPFHIAPTREQALAEVSEGFEEWADYVRGINPAGPLSLGMESPKFINESGNGAIGTPEDAVRALERYWKQTGGFGCILVFGQNWASEEATHRSYKMFVEYVMPQFAQRHERRRASFHYLTSNVKQFSQASQAAAEKTTARILAEEASKRGTQR